MKSTPKLMILVDEIISDDLRQLPAKNQRFNVSPSEFVSGHNSGVTWPSWWLSSPATPLFVQSFVRAYIKENTKAPRYRPFVWGIHRWPMDSQRARDEENVSVWWSWAYYIVHVGLAISNSLKNKNVDRHADNFINAEGAEGRCINGFQCY